MKVPNNDSVQDWFYQINRFEANALRPCFTVNCPAASNCGKAVCLEHVCSGSLIDKVIRLEEILNEST